jgi:hypothetical protein
MYVRRNAVAWPLLVAAVLMRAQPRAAAQDEPQINPAPPAARDRHPSADFKGAVGLGLIGAELGFVIPALVGARDVWPYIVFPVVGAAGGALAGYYWLERGAGEPELAVAVLVAGMALAVPATVVTVAAMAYEPDTELRPITAAQRSARAAAAAGPGLLRVSAGGVFVAPPGLAVGGSIGVREALRTGASRSRGMRIALFSGVF